MNSGSFKISVSSWMYNLSFYFKCILVLTKCFTLLRPCCRCGYILYMLVRVLWFAQRCLAINWF